ncbi:MAG: DEAD/DEAH box helicase [Clostridia bacterium]|nr:DEAD/DEAH box helicase [Clostridia bacterium]
MIENKGFKEYRGLVLDQFQVEAMEYIDRELSVLVSAPTGVGKTLIADYTIEKCHQEGRQVVYTAPIKALSNQKYKDFKNQFGDDAVGIITGDIVINSDAPVLVMTTEIFRNMLLTHDPIMESMAYLILDEVHYISDVERGSVWEESIIFMPEHIRLLGLSATIPNVDELANWISSIRQEDVKVVKNFKRAVPLKHYVFEKNMGLGTVKDVLKVKDKKTEEWKEDGLDQVFRRPKFVSTTHVDLINYIKGSYLPCLYFVFSRKKCEEFAFELSRNLNFLNNKERGEVDALLEEKAKGLAAKANVNAVARIHKVLTKGIGYHHAGMLPIVKDVVEELLARRLIKVLYCTETFAVGINMPVRTVCFDSNEKYDGKEFRVMTNQEYFQMAGRAGRRGIDTEGFVFSLADINYFEPDKMVKADEGRLEDLKSQFNLGYNSVVNLINNHQTEEEIFSVLQNNFAFYQVARESRVLEESLQRIEDEIKGLLNKRCEDFYHPKCSIQYNKLRSKLREAKAELIRMSRGRGGGRNHEKKRRLNHRVKELEQTIKGLTVRKCPDEQIEECRLQRKRYNQLEEEKNLLRKRYSSIKKQIDFVEDFRLKRELLTDLGFVEKDQLTARGRFATQIYVQELLVTELYFDGVFHELDEEQISALVACIGYEGRKNDWFKKAPVFDLERVYRLIQIVNNAEYTRGRPGTVMFHPEVALLAYQWSAEEKFENLRQYTNLQDGDVVSLFRRAIDLMRQIRSAAHEDKFIVAKLSACIKKLDRDVVQVNL